jgi:hypothetical protein
MKKGLLISVAITGLVLTGKSGIYAQDLVWEEISRGEVGVSAVVADPDQPNIIYMGSDKGVFKTEDSGLTWHKVLSLAGEGRKINFLLFNPENTNCLYAATANGLFYSANQGQDWKRIFRGKNASEGDCVSVAVLTSGIYLGTKDGLWISKDKGRSWSKQAGKLGKSQILAIANNPKEPQSIYVACCDGVFRTLDAGKSWERTFIANISENGEDKEEENEDRNEEEKFSDLRHLQIDSLYPHIIYLSSKRGVYISQDKAKTWKLLSDEGLLAHEVKFLLVSSDAKLYAASASSIFEYRKERWHELSFGLGAVKIYFLAADYQGNLYAACDKGLFRVKPGLFTQDNRQAILAGYAQNEPKISDLQQAAIKYAEVDAQKIKEWRRGAKMKAILPKLTVSIDRSEGTNYEIYTSATTRYVYQGPNDKHTGWDVALSWELGDLIWNDAQTSIDVRSRLMVQLRDDILDEVNKTYFERLRLKRELESLSLEEIKKRHEKELRVQELAASLDALTGGYFSQQIKK